MQYASQKLKNDFYNPYNFVLYNILRHTLSHQFKRSDNILRILMYVIYVLRNTRFVNKFFIQIKTICLKIYFYNKLVEPSEYLYYL